MLYTCIAFPSLAKLRLESDCSIFVSSFKIGLGLCDHMNVNRMLLQSGFICTPEIGLDVDVDAYNQAHRTPLDRCNSLERAIDLINVP